jgi:murein DD-endopeptidase MepM/ murein hydrolase activator NlpD
MPKISMPRISIPKVSMPKVPKPRISVPRLSAPSIRLPSLPRPSLPRPSLPRFKFPRRRRRQPVDPRVREHRRQLLRGTAKAGAGLCVAFAVAVGLGALIGLPLPGSGSDELAPGASGDIVVLDQGTASGISSEGPFFPILAAKVDYGEKAAHFGGGRGHPGQDVFAPVGTPLVAVRPGKIVDWGTVNGPYSGGRGNYLGIYNAEDNRTYNYLHMKQPSPFRVGQSVAAGQVVGHLGCTGYCDGPHLHFEIRPGIDDLRRTPDPINPLPIMVRWPKAPTPASQP